MLSALFLLALNGFAQERRAKLRISNAGFTITALPLLAAKDWGLFTANGLDMEVILMQSSLVPAALTQGDIDFQAGVGPASVNATMTGFATRAIWFSSDRISYWLMAKPQFKTLESLKAKKVAITGLGRHGSRRFQHGAGKTRRESERFCSGLDRRTTNPAAHFLGIGLRRRGAAVAAGHFRRAEKRLQQSLGRRRHGGNARRRPHRAG